jgi:hypothetical protein
LLGNSTILPAIVILLLCGLNVEDFSLAVVGVTLGLRASVEWLALGV